LQRLSGTFVSQPILVILAERADPGLVFKAMRAGATQVVTLPLQIEDFKDALNCIALQFNQSRASLKVIAFTGASGGYGVTSVALNAAYEIAFQHKRGAILVECLQQMGMVETYLDLKPKYTVRDLLKFGPNLDSHAVRNSLTHIADHFPQRRAALQDTVAQRQFRAAENSLGRHLSAGPVSGLEKSEDGRRAGNGMFADCCFWRPCFFTWTARRSRKPAKISPRACEFNRSTICHPRR
jgi:hypothetical protein